MQPLDSGQARHPCACGCGRLVPKGTVYYAWTCPRPEDVAYAEKALGLRASPKPERKLERPKLERPTKTLVAVPVSVGGRGNKSPLTKAERQRAYRQRKKAG